MGNCILFVIYLQISLASRITGYQFVSDSVQGCYSHYTGNQTAPKSISLNLSCDDASHIIHIVEIIHIRPSKRGDKICKDSDSTGCCKFDHNEICFKSMKSNDTGVIGTTNSCQNKNQCVIKLKPFNMEGCSTENKCHRDWFEQDGSCWSRIVKLTYVCYAKSGKFQSYVFICSVVNMNLIILSGNDGISLVVSDS